MLGALIIVFREVIEAGLIVGIVMAATRGVSGRGRWVSIGVIAGVVGAAVVALFAGAISDAFQGSGQAGGPDRAVMAQGLGVLDIRRRLCEPELRVEHPTRHLGVSGRFDLFHQCVE